MSKALFDDMSRASIPQGDPRSFVVAGIDTDDGADHPLVHAESNAVRDEDLEPLVRSIYSAGFDGAIQIAKLGGRPYVVAGRRRVRAARIANERREAAGLQKIIVKAVPYVPGKNRDAELLGAVIRSDELRRTKTPLERARQAARLQQLGMDIASTAAWFGVTEQAVKAWNELLSLNPAVQAKVESGELTANAARAVRGLDDKAQAETIAAFEGSGEKVTAAAVTKAVRRRAERDNEKAPPSTMVGKKEVRTVMDRYDLPATVALVLEWVMGERTEEAAFAPFPERPTVTATPPVKRRTEKVAPDGEGFSIDDTPE